MKGLVIALMMLLSVEVYATKNLKAFLIDDNESLIESLSWTGRNKELYLNLTLKRGLAFSSEFYYKLIEGKEIMCKIDCIELEDFDFQNKEGHRFKKLEILLKISKASEKGKLDYELSSNVYFIGENEESFCNKYLYKNEILNPEIDIEKSPRFFILDDSYNRGYFMFSNLFVFSEFG